MARPLYAAHRTVTIPGVSDNATTSTNHALEGLGVGLDHMTHACI